MLISSPTEAITSWTAQLASRLRTQQAVWQAIRFGTGPVDRKAAEDGVRTAYAAAKLEQPERLVWCKGPNELAELWRTARSGAFGENVRHLLIDRQRERVYTQLNSRVPAAVWGRVASALAPPPSDTNTDLIWDAIVETVDRDRPSWWRRTILRVAGRKTPRNPAGVHARDGWFGQFEATWVGVHDFFTGLDAKTTECVQGLGGLSLAVKNAGWLVPYEKQCLISERPLAVRLNEGLLHDAHAPVLQYGDGWRTFAWKGVGLNSFAIEQKDRLTFRHIATQRSPAVRRCLIEIITPERFVHMGRARRDVEDETGVLWRARFADGDVWTAVEVSNGTAEPDGSFKHYFLSVPSDILTARDAVAWTYGLTGSQYSRLQVRT